MFYEEISDTKVLPCYKERFSSWLYSKASRISSYRPWHLRRTAHKPSCQNPFYIWNFRSCSPCHGRNLYLHLKKFWLSFPTCFLQYAQTSTTCQNDGYCWIRWICFEYTLGLTEQTEKTMTLPLQNMLKSNAENLADWISDDDVCIVDRGFRDSVDFSFFINFPFLKLNTTCPLECFFLCLMHVIFYPFFPLWIHQLWNGYP